MTKSNPPSKRRNVNTAAKNLITQQKKSKRLACTPPNPEIIDLNELPDSPPTAKRGKWMETPLYTLSDKDRDILLNPTGWLNDNLIVAAQNLLYKQSSVPGFQDTCLGQSMSFEIQQGEFIQVLHDGHGHWLVVSGHIGEDGSQEIHVYDSMYPTVGTYTKKQIASIISSNEKEIKLKMINVQKQLGGCDCGLFAIAFATTLATGNQPEQCFFDQAAMRRHLYECLTKQEMSMFPHKPRRITRMVKQEDTLELFCTCRMPEIPPMVECSRCCNWYHVNCVSVPQEALDNSSTEWICQYC